MERVYRCKQCGARKDIDSPIGEDIGRIIDWCQKCQNLTDWFLEREYHDFGVINGRHVTFVD